MLLILAITGLFCAAGTSQELQYPGYNEKLKSIFSAYWAKYYDCMLNNFHFVNKLGRTPLTVHMLFPGQSIKLPCALCDAPFANGGLIEWKYESMRNKGDLVPVEDMYEEWSVSDQGELNVRNGKTEFTGVYHCFYGNNLIASTVLEIPAITQILRVDNQGPIDSPTISLNEMSIKISWGAWSECSACDVVGKKYRFGTCMVIINDTGTISNANEHQLLELFNNTMPCSSQFLPKQIAEQVQRTKATNYAAVKFCKEPCMNASTLNKLKINKDILQHLKGNGKNAVTSLRQNMANIQRIIVHSAIDSFLILQCPGWSNENIPIAWRKMGRELIDDVISLQTSNRITLDVFQRIIINNTLESDADIYSCWQRSRLLGVVNVYIDTIGNGIGQLFEFIGSLTAILTLIVSLHVGIRAFKHRAIYRSL